jgi:hypothetical protein
MISDIINEITLEFIKENKMATTKRSSTTGKSAVRRGRPIMHELTAGQIKAIKSRLQNGLGVVRIANELDLVQNAVLRVRRNMVSAGEL